MAELYFKSVGAAQIKDVVKLFGWKPAEAEKAIADLAQAGILKSELSMAAQSGEWIAVAELADDLPAQARRK